MAFTLLVHGTVPKDEICGVIVGHVWYFFSDVYPSLHGGHRPLDPPAWWRRLFEGSRSNARTNTIRNEPGAEDTRAANINQDIAAVAAPEVR